MFEATPGGSCAASGWAKESRCSFNASCAFRIASSTASLCTAGVAPAAKDGESRQRETELGAVTVKFVGLHSFQQNSNHPAKALVPDCGSKLFVYA